MTKELYADGKLDRLAAADALRDFCRGLCVPPVWNSP